jgi:TM2 domain-containing membrane protein YozV
MKNKGTTILLTLFLGGLGAHRFYLDQSGKGLIYLLFCWTLIPAVIALIDLIVFATMSQQTFDLQYNREYYNNIRKSEQKKSTPADSLRTKLEELDAMLASKLITEEEYKASRKKLIE